MAKITMTLSRAHKVAERLKAKMSEAAAEADAGFGTVRVEGVAGESQIQALASGRQKALKALAAHEQLNGALFALRSAIGRANASAGVSDGLAEQEMISRRLKLLRGIVAGSSARAIAPEDLADYRPLTTVKEVYGHRETGVEVTLLTLQAREELEAEIERLQKRAYKISDKVADANAAKVEIDLPDELVAELGL